MTMVLMTIVQECDLETAVALIATNDNGTGVSYSGWDDSDL